MSLHRSGKTDTSSYSHAALHLPRLSPPAIRHAHGAAAAATDCLMIPHLALAPARARAQNVVGARRAPPAVAVVSVRRETDVLVVATSCAHPAVRVRVRRHVAREAERLLVVHLRARLPMGVGHRDARAGRTRLAAHAVDEELERASDLVGKVGCKTTSAGDIIRSVA